MAVDLFYHVPLAITATAVAEFIDLDWVDKVNSGIGLSHWPARLHGLADHFDNPMPESVRDL